MSLSKTTITKQPWEKRRLSMPFSNKMATGETITEVVSVTSNPVGITSEDESYSGQIAQALLSGGEVPSRTDDNTKTYIITFRVRTSAGQDLENDGTLVVREDD